MTMCKNILEPDWTHGNTILRMRFACWMTKTADRHSEYVILLFHGNSGYANVSQPYLYTYTSPIL